MLRSSFTGKKISAASKDCIPFLRASLFFTLGSWSLAL
jgi:hypothetical protein